MINADEVEIKIAAYDDLFYFTKHILNYDLLSDTIHRDMCEFAQHSKGNILCIEPRDHFKTTCLTIGMTLWHIVNNPNIRILINHKSLSKSAAILSEIKGHFKMNETFLHFFGDWVGEVWSADKITVNKRTVNKKEPTVSIGAVTHEITSAHYDLIINDDLAGLRDMVSEAERTSTLNFYKSLKYLRDKGTFIKMLTTGTRWHLEDIYHYIKTKTKTEVREKKAIQDDGTPYFKERYSIKELREMEAEDPVFFESQMQNNPTALSNQLYALDKLNFFDMESFSATGFSLYVDPAFGKNERGDPCYFSMPIGVLVNEGIYVVEWINNKSTPEMNEILVVEKIKEYNIMDIVIESNAQQSEFIRNVEKQLFSQNVPVSVRPLNHSTNKDRRIQAMHGTVTNKTYFRKDWADLPDYAEGMRQLTLYPYSKFKDAPDALEGLLSTIAFSAIPRIR